MTKPVALITGITRSPYAVAKLYAYGVTVNDREAYGFHASNKVPV
jgi:GDP-D-mannose dehydratase